MERHPSSSSCSPSTDSITGFDEISELPVNVVGEETQAHPDLVGCQACTSRQGDGLFQVSHQADKRVIELADGIAGGTEYGITEQADGTLGHRAILP